jgi:hypothetical protein
LARLGGDGGSEVDVASLLAVLGQSPIHGIGAGSGIG